MSNFILAFIRRVSSVYAIDSYIFIQRCYLVANVLYYKIMKALLVLDFLQLKKRILLTLKFIKL